MYFSARAEGRISYGHLGRTDSCFYARNVSWCHCQWCAKFQGCASLWFHIVIFSTESNNSQKQIWWQQFSNLAISLPARFLLRPITTSATRPLESNFYRWLTRAGKKSFESRNGITIFNKNLSLVCAPPPASYAPAPQMRILRALNTAMFGDEDLPVRCDSGGLIQLRF